MPQGILQPCAAKPDLLKKEGNMRKLRIFTDGACANNQKRINAGGWGAILVFGETKKELYGGEANTTNNRMEMTALIEALGALKRKGLQMDVFSDSSYLMDCFRKRWYVNWQKEMMAYSNVYAGLIVIAVMFYLVITVLFKIRDRVLGWQKGVIKW